MTSRVLRIALGWLLSLTPVAEAGSAPKGWRDAAVKVYLDCGSCFQEFIRTEVAFVNYVRERGEADVHVLITTQPTAAEGKEYTLAFIGQRAFQEVGDTLTFVARPGATEDAIRRGLVKTLKAGLVRYVARTPLLERLGVSFDAEWAGAPVRDKWTGWVFTIEGDGSYSEEKSRRFLSGQASVGADRVTPEWKITLGLRGSYSERRFLVDDGRIVSTTRSHSTRGLVVKSLGDHWSAGLSTAVSGSTFGNVSLSVSAGPAVEWNLFPYSDSTRRQLRFLYKIASSGVRYEEETIFDKTSERLAREELSVTLEQRQRWGSLQASLEGSHYLHDFNKNRLELSGRLSVRLVEGLSLRLSGEASSVRDRLSLPKRGATTEEILLQRRQLATDHHYQASVGLTYSFGSIYSNVVNPRFGR